MTTAPPETFVAALEAHRGGDYARAEVFYRQTLAAFPHAASAYHNLATLLRARGRIQDADGVYREALRRCQPNAEFAFQLGLSRLAAGDYAEGFALFEARRAMPDAVPLPHFSFPEWDGAPVSRLLVYLEQGLGDQILFSRYVPLLKARGIAVTLVCRPALARLFAALDVELIPAAGEVKFEGYDAWTLLGSLPRHFTTRIDSVPPPARLRVSGARRGGVGVMARGNPDQANDRNRSMPSGAAAALAALPGAVDLSPDATGARDMQDTAEIIAGLDGVVSVCTSVANVAASIGAPTWVMLPALDPCWRWNGPDGRSAWYPQARLFRQPLPGDWASVLGEVRAALARGEMQGSDGG